MTPTDLARKQPAEIVIYDSRTAPDFVLLDPPAPRTRADVRWLLRLFAVLFLLGAGFQMWCAATGYRPF